MAGAPKGNRNGAHNKPWTRALERHAAQNPDKLATLAEKTFAMALDGDIQAMREIGDRLDGKPKQTIDGDLTVYEPDIDAEFVRSRIADRIAARLAQFDIAADADSGVGDTKV